MSKRKQQDRWRAKVVRQAQAALASGAIQPGRLYEVFVVHDTSCHFPDGRGACTCNPSVSGPVPVDLGRPNDPSK